MKTWQEVLTSPEYQGLDEQRRWEAKNQYFNEVITPKAIKTYSNEELPAIRNSFFNTKYNEFDPIEQPQEAPDQPVSIWKETIKELGKAYPSPLETARRLIRGEERPFGDIPEALFGGVAYETAGIIKGLTLGYVKPEKILEKFEYFREMPELRKKVAGVGGQLVGALVPISMISQGVGWGLKFLNIAKYSRPFISALAQAGITGGIYGIVRNREEQESRLQNARDDAGLFVLFTAGMFGIDKVIKNIRFGKTKLYNSLRQDIINKFKGVGKGEQEATAVTDALLRQAVLKKGGWDKVTRQTLKESKKFVKTLKKTVEPTMRPAEPAPTARPTPPVKAPIVPVKPTLAKELEPLIDRVRDYDGYSEISYKEINIKEIIEDSLDLEGFIGEMQAIQDQIDTKASIDNITKSMSKSIGKDTAALLKIVDIERGSPMVINVSWDSMKSWDEDTLRRIKQIYNFHAAKTKKPLMTELYFGRDPDNIFKDMTVRVEEGQVDRDILKRATKEYTIMSDIIGKEVRRPGVKVDEAQLTDIWKEATAKIEKPIKPAIPEKPIEVEPKVIPEELKPKPLLSKFLPRDDEAMMTKQGEYTNGQWLLKPEFTPEKLKLRMEIGVKVSEHPDAKGAWDLVEKELFPVGDIAGYMTTEMGKSVYIFKLENGNNIAIQKPFYDYLQKHIPSFNLKASKNTLPISIFSGNKKAGLVMPIKVSGDDVEAIKWIKPTRVEITPTKKPAEVVRPKLPVIAKPKPKFEVYAGVDIGIDKFVAEDVKPLAIKVRETGRALGKSAKIIPKILINIFEPSKAVERHLGKETYARVIRGIHKPEAKEIEFTSKQLEAVDSNINELGKWFGKYSKQDLENVMISRGHGLRGDARRLQIKAFASLPKELKDPQIRRAIDEIADFNYKFLQKVAGDDIHYVEDYFYGVYKNPKVVTRFLDYWRSTEKFTKQKLIPTVADAKVYGLELKDKNPVENLKREFLAISKLEAMNWMKGELLRTGEGIYIAPKEKAPIDWEKVNDPVFKDLRLEPELAKLINNLISTNKISQVPVLNALRLVNNTLRSIKFIGSAFHLGVVSKQAVADSGYLGFAYRKTALRGATTGFRADDPIFRTPEYKDYLEHGGGHRFSIESDAQTMLANGFDKIIRGNQIGGWLRIGGTALKLPSEFVKWMFDKYIPKLKYSKYLDFTAEKEKALGRKLLSSEKIDIIKEQQNFYGMMNERLFGRSGTVTTVLRFFFMAPGFAEGNYRTMAKAGIQWGRKGTFGAGRSRFNIVNSLIITAILSTIGTMIFTRKLPKKPETLDDVRDLFKIDTGKVDTKGRKIMIDMLTYDKDYFNIYFNMARGRPDKAISESIKRIGGMKATTFGTITDLSMIMQGRALYDWKGDRIVEITDPFLKRMIKIAQYEIEKIQPISFSVFKQARRKGIDTFMAAIESLVGIRPTLTEADKREQKILQKMYSLYGQKDNLYRYLGTLNKPAERVEKYNDTVNAILNNKLVSEELRKEWEQKLIIDKDGLLAGKIYRLRRTRITDEEAEKIEKYIRNWGIKKEDETQYILMYRRMKGRRKIETARIIRRKHL